VYGSTQVHVKLELSNPSLVQLALASQGLDRHGSGTTKSIIQWRHKDIHQLWHILEQLKPSPTMNGSTQVHVKLELSNPSLVQLALASQGIDKQGSGTTKILRYKDSYHYTRCTMTHTWTIIVSISNSKWFHTSTCKVRTQQSFSGAVGVSITRNWQAGIWNYKNIKVQG